MSSVATIVIPGLDPVIHDVERALAARWTRGSSPRVTACGGNGLER